MAKKKSKDEQISSVLRKVLISEPILEDVKKRLFPDNPVSSGQSVKTPLYFDGIYLGFLTETQDSVTFKPDKSANK